MTREEFLAFNKSINDRLDLIAKRTANMAWMGTAHTDNSEFVELMRLQQQLLDAADRLIEKYYKQ